MSKKPKTIKIKRLWNGLASLRDYIVDAAIKTNRPLIVLCIATGEKMLLMPSDMKKAFQTNTSSYESKYGSRQYRLLDFAWKPLKNPVQEQLTLF